ncbi:MAG TPA: hypothetical protein VNA04_16650 [Thermoanaerobaculia bacterium]|nr:hypothetical protein [Thermoanaerobaculia bacterium]
MPAARALFVVLVLVTAAACGTGQPISTSGGRAAVGVQLVGSVFFGSGSTAPANLEVLVENRSPAEIVVRHIRVESSGMATWGIYPAQRTFRETLSPGQVRAFPMYATAATTRRSPTEPLTVRAVVQFDSGTERFQEFFSGMVHQD